MGDPTNAHNGNILWFGTSPEIIKRLRAGDVADELSRFGKVDEVVMKERCFHVYFASSSDAREVLLSRDRGDIRICNHKMSCAEFKEFHGAEFQDVGEERRENDAGMALGVDARELLEKVKEHRVWSKGLNFVEIDRMLRTLSYSTQVKALNTYMSSDFSSIRKPMGWFQSIVRTLGMGLDHGTRPTDTGFNRGNDKGYSGKKREDCASPRTMARESFRQREPSSSSGSDIGRDRRHRSRRSSPRRGRRQRSTSRSPLPRRSAPPRESYNDYHRRPNPYENTASWESSGRRNWDGSVNTSYGGGKGGSYNKGGGYGKGGDYGKGGGYGKGGDYGKGGYNKGSSSTYWERPGGKILRTYVRGEDPSLSRSRRRRRASGSRKRSNNRGEKDDERRSGSRASGSRRRRRSPSRSRSGAKSKLPQPGSSHDHAPRIFDRNEDLSLYQEESWKKEEYV